MTKNRQKRLEIAYEVAKKYIAEHNLDQELNEPTFSTEDFEQEVATEAFLKGMNFDPKRGSFEDYCYLIAMSIHRMAKAGEVLRNNYPLEQIKQTNIVNLEKVWPYQMFIDADQQMPETHKLSYYTLKSVIGYEYSELESLSRVSDHPVKVDNVVKRDVTNIINYIALRNEQEKRK